MSNNQIKIKDSIFSERVPPKPKSEAELQREKNIQERDAFLASFKTFPEYAEAVGLFGFDKENKTKSSEAPKPKYKKKHEDSAFRFSGNVPTERRKSLRLQDKEPAFTEDDLIEESSFKRKRYADSDYADLEDIVYSPKKKKTRVLTKHSGRPPIIPACDITEEMISKVARKVSVKVYSEMGTSCHQCRQKTLDQKTCCRNSKCIGVRGQICGVCLENRYGEDAAEALRDSDWNCPVCRGICNCSFCRAKAGKRPTGILTPLAHQAGHKSVKDFLQSLKGEGDYVYEHQDPRNLLGFTPDLDYAQMGGGIKQFLNCPRNNEELLMECIQRAIKDLKSLKKANEPVLLGFHENQPVFSGGIQL